MTNSEPTSAATGKPEKQRNVPGHVVDQRIIVMARCPEAGKVKTRLIPALGPDGAAKLHFCLVENTLKTVRQFTNRQSCDIEVQFTGGSTDDMQRLFGVDLQYTPQQGESLGDRMSFAIGKAFADGCRRVVVIGTDCPELETRHLEEAFSALHHSDVTIGPAIDGGYYLIGMREHYQSLFENVNWGNSTVFQETLQNLRRINKSSSLLPALSDVDFPEDLVFCRLFSEEFSAALPKPEAGLLSIVIPTVNEEKTLPRLLTRLLPEPQIEIIVADGGSTDNTCQIAKQAGVKVLRCSRGRGRQMNAGASISRGEVILFLHADAQLPDNFSKTIWDSVSAGYSGGAFRLRIDDDSWLYRIVEFGTNLRSHWLQLPYGDQGIFIRSDRFFSLNGFRNWPLLEDYDFVKRLGQLGPIMIAKTPTTVSARRWKRIGVLKATLLNQIIIAGFKLGVSPEKLATLYTRSK